MISLSGRGRGPPVLVCLLALEIPAGRRRESATVRARSSFRPVRRSPAFEKNSASPLGPVAQRRPVPCAQRRAGHNRKARRQNQFLCLKVPVPAGFPWMPVPSSWWLQGCKRPSEIHCESKGLVESALKSADTIPCRRSSDKNS